MTKIDITRTSDKGLTYEVEVPEGYDAKQILEGVAKQTELIEEFFNQDKGLNLMRLCYD